MTDTCPFVITKGRREGQICGEKTKPGVKYCRIHLRNLVVKEELGIIPPRPEPDEGPKNINSIYTKSIPVEKIPRKKPNEENKKKAFIDAFNKHIDNKLDTAGAVFDSEVKMKEIYDELDVGDDVDEFVEDEIEEEVDDPKLASLKKELEFEKEQNVKAQRRINAMFTMKQCLFTGVKASADICEHVCGDNLKGYSETVMKSNEVNALLDEMSDDFETLIGFSEMPCSIRLLLTMGILGSAVYTQNITGCVIKKPDPRNMSPDLVQDNENGGKEHPSFSPPYTN